MFRRLLGIGRGLVLLLITATAQAAIVSVTGVGDTVAVNGACTLREAITSINAAASVNADCPNTGAAFGTSDEIRFNIPGAGVHTIAPTSALPVITRAVLLDGYSQPGAVQNSAATGWNGSILIEIDGAAAGAYLDGLTVATDNATIRGLAIGRFSFGVVIGDGGSGAGGTANLNTVAGNFVGLRADGSTFFPNQNAAVVVGGWVGAWANTIGGAFPADRNVISGNDWDGIVIMNLGLGGWETAVLNNYIGTNAFLTAARPNQRHGINITDAVDNSIGRNVIAYNVGHGVTVEGTVATTGNTITANSIYDNTDMGINLDANGVAPNDPGDTDTGPNSLQNYPLLTSASAWGVVAGSLNSTPNTAFTIEFFSSPACDGSGYGEGRTFLGPQAVTTDAGGNAAFTFSGPVLTSGHVVTATAAAQVAQSTSEFSACVTVSPAPEIGISGNSVPIADGDTTPSLADHTDFGTSTVGTPVTRTYTILNSGTVTLNLGANAVSLLGAACGEFAVSVQPSTTVAASASTIFAVQYTPVDAGTDLCQVSINNDDPDESPYEFNVQGTGSPAPPGSPPVMGDVPNQNATVGSAFNLALVGYVTATNGDPILSYAIVTGALPPGLTIAASTGVISGTPTTAGTYNITVVAGDKDGWSNADAIQFTVTAAAAPDGAVPVPALSPWGLLVLSLLLSALVLLHQRGWMSSDRRTRRNESP
ncbi:MAG: IPTL-CTERM sorting domain-containing protein [Betaproteobacteria bacterium]|nr:IPTL-CTERM sorting domain-containing protein [Betaproteobacteria bacterium]